MFPIKDTIPRRQFPFITYLIIFVNTVIFIVEVILLFRKRKKDQYFDDEYFHYIFR